MKRKTITLVIYMLVCISLVSVGFAAWVITGGESTEATGNVTASVVTDSSITIGDKSWDSGKSIDEETGIVSGGTINFGAKEGVDNNSWLQSSGTDYEDLTAIFYFSISTKEGNIKSSVSSLSACTITLSENETVEGLRDDYNLIGDPKIEFKVSTSEFTIDKDTTGLTEYNKTTPNLQSAFTTGTTFEKDANSNAIKKAYVAVRITYTWGSAFGGNNPYEYFKTKTPSVSSGVNKSLYIQNGTGTLSFKEFAYEALNKLNKTLDESSGDDFTLEINFKSK